MAISSPGTNADEEVLSRQKLPLLLEAPTTVPFSQATRLPTPVPLKLEGIVDNVA